jgi:RND superfamily putative drug exporter
MDYEVFLVTRIYEAHKQGKSDKDAVRYALAHTGNVISSAALIMIIVFFAFIFSRVVLIKTLSLGLTVAIVLDATLVRSALVPAVMSLAGKWNWWLPKRFARIAERINFGHD